ncbi:MAG: lyase domain protein repeat-containing protein [Pedosphaera sp.]|nr:lyase domain protein repeat-containing protein [Pedosphaera sp.]
MTKKRSRIVLVVLLVAVVGGLAWQVTRPREPMYQAKPLTYWLQGYNQSPRYNQPPPLGSVTESQADEAVRQTGTNAIPTLLRLLVAKESVFTRRIVELSQKQHVIKIGYTPAWERTGQAIHAFSCLGASAKAAVPTLITMYEQDHVGNSRSAIAVALGAIGPAAATAVPLLIQGINNTNSWVRLGYIQSLGHLHAEPALVVPALVRALPDPNTRVRCTAVETLGTFGADARQAVPALVELLSNRSIDVRWAATNALKAIDPEAAARAGVN